MTEITVEKKNLHKVRPFAFVAALVLAPLTLGAPAFALIWLMSVFEPPNAGPIILVVFPAAATVLGAPTYLLFGGPAFWYALRRGIWVPWIAVLANLVSLPLVFGVFLMFEPLSDVPVVVGTFGLLGTVFAFTWGAIFQALYRRFAKERPNA